MITDFQSRVLPWLLECFGEEIASDTDERNHRFLEEALELVQACGTTASEAHQLVDYVYGREVGEKGQEVGGVMVTLAALCLAQDLHMHDLGEKELGRIWTKVQQIREKQAKKPKHSPLAEGSLKHVHGPNHVAELAELAAAAKKGLHHPDEQHIGQYIVGIENGLDNFIYVTLKTERLDDYDKMTSDWRNAFMYETEQVLLLNGGICFQIRRRPDGSVGPSYLNKLLIEEDVEKITDTLDEAAEPVEEIDMKDDLDSHYKPLKKNIGKFVIAFKSTPTKDVPITSWVFVGCGNSVSIEVGSAKVYDSLAEVHRVIVNNGVICQIGEHGLYRLDKEEFLDGFGNDAEVLNLGKFIIAVVDVDFTERGWVFAKDVETHGPQMAKNTSVDYLEAKLFDNMAEAANLEVLNSVICVITVDGLIRCDNRKSLFEVNEDFNLYQSQEWKDFIKNNESDPKFEKQFDELEKKQDEEPEKEKATKTIMKMSGYSLGEVVQVFDRHHFASTPDVFGEIVMFNDTGAKVRLIDGKNPMTREPNINLICKDGDRSIWVLIGQIKGENCHHAGYNFDDHGRNCPRCGALLTDFGD